MATKILSSALDVDSSSGKEQIMLRGRINPASLGHIRADRYQRGQILQRKINQMKTAIMAGKLLPDIELGMRGSETRSFADGTTILMDEVYVIDGLQRITANRQLMTEDPAFEPRLGAKVFFDTTFEWEATRFHDVNQTQTKVSINIILRNARDKSPILAMVHKLTENDDSCVLFGRVSWEQNMAKANIMTARVMLHTVAALHRRFGPAGNANSLELATQMDTMLKGGKCGPISVRENVKLFFASIDRMFGIRSMVIRDQALYVRGTFMRALATLYASHDNFWQGMKLVVPQDIEQKMRSFAFGDPNVAKLCGAGGAASIVLRQIMVEHINHGKRTHRLVPTVGMVVEEPQEPDAPVE